MQQTPEAQDAENRERRSPGRSAIAAMSALQDSLGMLLRPRVGLPYLLWLAVQLLLTAAYLAWNTGPAASFWAVLLPGVTAEAIRHYPEHLILLQPVLNRLDLLLDIVARCLFHGATIVMLRAVFEGRAPALRASFGEAGRRYRDLVLVSLISSAAVYAAVFAGRLASALIEGPARYAAAAAWMGAGLFVQALFVYALPYVAIGGRSFAGALSGSVSLAVRLAVKTILIVAIPFILTLPTLLLGLKAELIALRLSPEFMIYLHVADRVMEMISMYLVTAGATMILLSRTGRRIRRNPNNGLITENGV